MLKYTSRVKKLKYPSGIQYAFILFRFGDLQRPRGHLALTGLFIWHPVQGPPVGSSVFRQQGEKLSNMMIPIINPIEWLQ